MSFVRKYSTEEEQIPLMEREAKETSVHSSSEQKSRLNPFMLAGIGSTIIAVTIIILAMSSSVTKSVMTNPGLATASKMSEKMKELNTKLKNTRATPTTLSKLAHDGKKDLFDAFKTAHKRVYKNEAEHSSRYSNFMKFLEKVDANNAAEVAKGGSGQHGITKFADWSEEEMKNLLNFKKDDAKKASVKSVLKKHTSRDEDEEDVTSTSSTFVDWRDVYTTPVKDQGYCGSCWAFSATEQIESDSIRAGYLTTSDDLSEQQIVSCDTEMYGCDGGYPSYAYEYVAEAGGIVSESTYPYSDASYYNSDSGTCLMDTTLASASKVVTVSAFYELSTEKKMKTHVLSTGPLSICLAADTWYTYTGGILSSCDTDVDHCVQAVGINTDDGYWIVRNSWGTTWGLEGYIYLAYGEDLCDLDYMATYTSVEQVSR